VNLQENDRLILATDGVSDHLDATQLAELVRRADTPEAAVLALREILSDKQRGHRHRMDTLKTWLTDDATAVIRYLGDRDQTVAHPVAPQ
jgi:serine/threonine protein phosphatase PrpC